MPDQISTMSANSGVGLAASDSLGETAEASRRTGEIPGQARAVVTVREQFNPLGAGLRSIWPQSVCGF